MNCHISFKCSPNLLVLHSFPTRRSSDLTRPRPLAFGAARTLLGIIAGVSYATMLGKFGVNRSEVWRSEEHTSNSSHQIISYAVFCLKKKKHYRPPPRRGRKMVFIEREDG